MSKWTLYCLFVECIVSHTADCPDVPSLDNGIIMYSAGSTNNRPFISNAVHSCNPGYTLTGGATRVCTSSRRWTGSPPTCQRKWYVLSVLLLNVPIPYTEIPCSDLPTLMVSYNGGSTDNRPVGTVATYTCDTGYILNGGTTTRTCGSDGVWSGSAPTCLSEWTLYILFVLSSTCSYVNTQYSWLQFPVVPLPLLLTDLLDNQPAQ